MKQANDLLNRAASIRKEKQGEKLAEIAAVAKEWGITAEQIAKKMGGHYAKKRELKAKYRDPVSGAEWSGVGNPPKWAAAWKEARGSFDGLEAGRDFKPEERAMATLYATEYEMSGKKP
jgi:DNA-binding protein H-NS